VQCALQACADKAQLRGQHASARQAAGREHVAAFAALSG
jgi:hypothetical protein